MATVICPSCRRPRAVSRSMACMVRKGRSTGRCRACATEIRTAERRLVAMQNLTARFWSKVERGEDCWLWRAGTDDRGYGRFAIAGRTCRAHRVAWELANGPIPGRHVLHRCDHPACVRPDHLFLGTHVENMRDMAAKGRRRGGRPLQERCVRGHDLTQPESRTASGDCRRCGRERAAAQRRRLLNLRAVERGAA